LILADVFGRFIGQGVEVPVGSVISLLGVPFFIWLLYRHRAQHV
jgi:ABC-type Fe3+-siderophore transport system permease subunit